VLNIRNMYIHEEKIRIRYSETDQMGYVYHGNYAAFYEIGRVESLRSAGIRYKDMEEIEGVMLPVLEIQSKFLKAIYYDEEITIRTYMREMPKVRAIFDFEIFNEKEELVHKAQTTLVFVKKETGRPCRAPQSLVEKLSPFFEVAT